MKTVAFVPIKLNSERLPGKNIKRFDDGTPLLSFILQTTQKVPEIDETYVYCSSDDITGYLPEGVTFLKRPQRLDASDISISEVIRAFTTEVDADVYVLLHATAPFLSAESIGAAIRAVTSDGYDSALSVKKHQDFLWLDGRPFNYDIANIPRTQDMKPFHIETTGMYVFDRKLAQANRRIGERPFLVEVSDIEAIDINQPIDFDIAEAIYKFMLKDGVQ